MILTSRMQTRAPRLVTLFGRAAPAAVLLAAIWLAFSPREAQAQENVVRVSPTGIEVAPEGNFRVAVIDEPPEQSLSAWVIELAFDPGVFSAASEDCDSLNSPPGSVSAFDCVADDTDDDGTADTVKILGVVLFTGTQEGLTQESTLASVKFRAVGDPGECSDLTLRIRIHADNEGEETGAQVQDGRACIFADAPPSGTASPVPFTPRTSAPILPGEDGEQPTLPGNNGQNGQETPETGEPGDTGPTDGTDGTQGSTDASGGTGDGTSSDGGDDDGNGGSGGLSGDDDDGGVSAIVWVVVGVFALGAAAAGAWALVRLRGARPPTP